MRWPAQLRHRVRLANFSWWLVAIAFALAERCVVHLHFGRGAHSFSLGDIPLVFGLIFCSANGVVLGCLLGSGLALLFDRRLPTVKFMFNVAQFALHACIAVLVIHAIAPANGALLEPVVLKSNAGVVGQRVEQSEVVASKRAHDTEAVGEHDRPDHALLTWA